MNAYSKKRKKKKTLYYSKRETVKGKKKKKKPSYNELMNALWSTMKINALSSAKRIFKILHTRFLFISQFKLYIYSYTDVTNMVILSN